VFGAAALKGVHDLFALNIGPKVLMVG